MIKTTIPDFNPPPVKINLTVFSEGLYNPALDLLSRKDTVSVYLRKASSPYGIIDSPKAPIDSLSKSGLFEFSKVTAGNYFIVVKHFNSLETWSKAGGELFTVCEPVFAYDFSDSAAKAYGSNLRLTGSKYCIYSGDINNNGSVDLDDVLFIFNDGKFYYQDQNL